MNVVAVNGSPSAGSKTHELARVALELAGGGTLIDIGALDADALLLRGSHASVQSALDAITNADVLLLATPVYRATFSGLLKVLLDQLAYESLRGTAVVLAASAGSRDHFLALDTGLRAVVASLAGWCVPTVVYATSDDFDADGRPNETVLTALRTALDEAATLGT